mgnify:CR=1 FL=1
MKIPLLALLVTLLLTAFPSALSAAESSVVLKMSILAPEGSAWVNQFKSMNEELQKAIGGQVQFKIYPGGIMGDDDVVLRKIRVGQLDGACLTSRGLYKIYPDFRVLTLPGVFRSDSEIDVLLQKLTPDLIKSYQDLGFETLGFTGVGFTYLYSQKDIRNTDDLKKSKAWLWENDPVMKALYAAADVTPVSLGVGDVMTALQTGLLDTVFNTPTGILSLQWFSKINYMSDLPLSYSFGGFLISDKAWQRVPENLREPVREIVSRHMKNITDQIRLEDQRAIEVIKGRGVQMTTPSEDFRKNVESISADARKTLIDSDSSKILLEKIITIVGEPRH